MNASRSQPLRLPLHMYAPGSQPFESAVQIAGRSFFFPDKLFWRGLSKKGALKGTFMQKTIVPSCNVPEPTPAPALGFGSHDV